MPWPSRSPAGRIAYVDGQYVRHGEAAVHVEDRGLQFGDSVYEVWQLKAGVPCDLEPHLDRLERSLQEIEMALPMGRAALKQVLFEIVRRNAIADGILYLQITRGAFRRDHPIPSGAQKPSLILTVRRLDQAALRKRMEEGIAVLTRPDPRWARCDIKTTQLLANLLAKTEARREGAFEVWFTDSDGYVTEGASTTAWIVDAQGTLITRSLSPALLPGVTRRVLLELAKSADIPVEERAFSPDEALCAQEAFVTSATAPALPVVAIDGVAIGSGLPGPLTCRLQTLYGAQSQH